MKSLVDIMMRAQCDIVTQFPMTKTHSSHHHPQHHDDDCVLFAEVYVLIYDYAHRLEETLHHTQQSIVRPALHHAHRHTAADAGGHHHHGDGAATHDEANAEHLNSAWHDAEAVAQQSAEVMRGIMMDWKSCEESIHQRTEAARQTPHAAQLFDSMSPIVMQEAQSRVTAFEQSTAQRADIVKEIQSVFSSALLTSDYPDSIVTAHAFGSSSNGFGYGESVDLDVVVMVRHHDGTSAIRTKEDAHAADAAASSSTGNHQHQHQHRDGKAHKQKCIDALSRGRNALLSLGIYAERELVTQARVPVLKVTHVPSAIEVSALLC